MAPQFAITIEDDEKINVLSKFLFKYVKITVDVSEIVLCIFEGTITRYRGSIVLQKTIL